MINPLMKIFTMAFLCLTVSALSGCAPRVVVNGNSYVALTSEEESMLKAIALKTLENNVGRSIRESEFRFAKANDPTLIIDYSGDRYGDARVSWQMPTRKITLVFKGELLSDHMECLMQTVDNQPELIDFTDVPISKSIKGVPPKPPREMKRSSSTIVR